jgi:peptidoglycan/xylan/chitin deacetylase (PgdA/CDA1 family)
VSKRSDDCRVLGVILPKPVLVVTVHGIGSPKRALDPGEDRTWLSLDQFDRVLDEIAGRTEVRLTFDDGNESDVELALPRLMERSLTAEFFLLAGRIGQAGSVDGTGLRAIVDAGMSVGSHGWDHVDWRRLSDDTARRELGEAPQALAELTGQPVRRVAVPFGSYDRVVLRRLRSFGVDCVYTSDGGRARPESWLQPRNSLRHDLTPETVRDLVAGRTPLLRRHRRQLAMTVKRWRGAASD